MPVAGYTLGVFGLCVILAIFSFVDRIYRQLGRVSTGTLREHIEIFESEVEPRFRLDRRRASLGFAILNNLALVVVAVETARGVLLLVPTVWQAVVQLIAYLVVEVLVCVHFIPELLIVRTSTRWLKPLVPALQAALLIIWPLRASLELAISVARISEEELPPGTQAEQDGLEALVEAAQEDGILGGDKAQLIEQVVEFSDKRVLELMTPRPDIVAIPANATIEQMRRLLVETKFSRARCLPADARRRCGHRARAGSAADSGERSEAPHGAGIGAPGALCARDEAWFRPAAGDAPAQSADGHRH